MPERRAYICEKCAAAGLAYRVFLFPGEPEPPRCPQHGKMAHQVNKPYPRPAGGKR